MSVRLFAPALLVTVALTTGCGDEPSEPHASIDMTVTRADATVVEFPNGLRASCGPFDEDNADTEAVHIMAGKRGPHSTFWQLTAVQADVERDPVTTLPNSFDFTEPRGATLFAYDNKPRGNEVSSAEEESSGTIRVELAGCDPGDTVQLTFDHVVLGSELHDLGSLSFDGEVVAVISEAH
ncbi:MAG: hypothetical protein H0W87_01185 [Actinobacteria bacterium]|nr:hypothetical protein [Actinomycetota bacterium]